jgi:hypothetical protein
MSQCVKKPYADWATAMTEIKRVNRNGSQVEREPYECSICGGGIHHISYLCRPKEARIR